MHDRDDLPERRPHSPVTPAARRSNQSGEAEEAAAIPPREARRARLDRARQADRHDLDPGGRRDQAAVLVQARRPRRHARSARLGLPADRARRGDQDRSFVMDGRKIYRFTVRWGEERDTDDADGAVVATSERASGPRRDRGAAAALHRHHLAGAAAVFGDQDRGRARLRPRPRRRDRRTRRPGRSKSTGSSWLTCPTPTPPNSRPNAARAPMSGRWPATSAGRSDVCGHIKALRREAVGSFGENDMISLEQLTAMCHRAAAGEASLADALLPVETALDDIPALAVSRADAARLQRGQAVLLRGRDAPIFRGTVYVTVSGQLGGPGRSGPRRDRPQARIQPGRAGGKPQAAERSLADVDYC